jgi:hypothetical protein
MVDDRTTNPSVIREVLSTLDKVKDQVAQEVVDTLESTSTGGIELSHEIIKTVLDVLNQKKEAVIQTVRSQQQQ